MAELHAFPRREQHRVRRFRLAVFMVGLALLATSCQYARQIIPTAAQLPTITPTPIVAAVARRTLPPTWTPTETLTPSPTSTITPSRTSTTTPTVTPSDTPTLTPTLTPSRTPTQRPTTPPQQLPPPTAVAANPSNPNPQPAANSNPAPQSPMFSFPAPGMVHDPNDSRVARLYNVPILSSISPRVAQIFAQGRAMGNRPNVFSKVGDCHTTAHAFFLPLGVGEYDLGPYGYLAEAINFFGVPPRDGVANSFVNDSFAASSAFNMAAVLDSTWANPSFCQPQESPLACEYRNARPAVAIIFLGSVDMQVYNAEQFRASTQQVIRETINRGIVPVLTTYPSTPGYMWEESLNFNVILTEVAQAEQIPLINLWLASRSLPNYGLEGDGFHISAPANRFVSFNGDERQWGQTLRNLLTLHMLEALRRDVLTR